MYFKKELKTILIIFLFSTMAIFIHGYKFGISDQEIFIPYILKSQDANLFEGDMLFKQKSSYLSVFYPLMGYLVNIINIETLFFVLYLLFHFLLYLGFFYLSKLLLHDRRLAFLSLLTLVIPKFIGGTALLTYDSFFGYRLIGNTFFLYFLTSIIARKFKLSLLFAFLAAIFHPLSVVPNILLFCLLFKNYLSKHRKINLLTVAGGILSVVFFVNYTGVIRNDLWFSVLRDRVNYVFISQWGVYGWASFFMYFFLVVIFLGTIKQSIRDKVRILLLLSLFTFTIHFILLELLKISAMAQFQLLRSIQPIAYIGLALTPLFLTAKDKFLMFLGIGSFITLATNFFLPFFAFASTFLLVKHFRGRSGSLIINNRFITYTVLSTVFILLITNLSLLMNFRKHFQFPRIPNDFILVQKWAFNNTIAEDIFLVPPDEPGFRIFSQRAIVGDIKDGAVSLYDFDYALYWSQYMKDNSNYYEKRENDFLDLREKYYFNYIITPDKDLDFNKIFQNNRYSVYKLL